MSDRIAAISVDLDEILCYTQIHGLRSPPAGGSGAIYRKAVARFEHLFDEIGVKATFFVIGRDLDDGDNARTVERLYARGHEIANHSANHLYDFSRRDRATIKREIQAGAQAIQKVTGNRPLGFRAPGYTVTDTIFRELEQAGVVYDSSVFPCPLYYAAKAAAIAAIHLAGSRSHSVTDTPFVLGCPTEPYRVGLPYWRRGQGLLELPIGLTPASSGRLPFIGTSLVLAGKSASAFLARLMRATPFVNLELHGIDLADAQEDGLDFLRQHRMDLRPSWRQKRAALRAAIEVLQRASYRFVTLAEAAEEFARRT
ncbi:MAG: polysaccharide deacetylase family protein [Deltaproteobacteria bacterium]|nr:polysaccharide deacetylase family protein [Deltaproteobacteria bacterium]